MLNSQNGPTVVSYETWLAALASSACIGFTSLVPWLFNMTFFEQRKLKTGQLKEQDGRMKFLLSFAVGAILGDIFFHLIPESFHSHIVELSDSNEAAHKKVGLSIVGGIFMFIIVEMVLEKWSHSMSENDIVLVEEERDKRSAGKEMHFLNNNNHKNDQQIPIFNTIDLKQTVGALINSSSSNQETEIENNNNLINDFNDFQNNNNNFIIKPLVDKQQVNCKRREKHKNDKTIIDHERNYKETNDGEKKYPADKINKQSDDSNRAQIVDMAGYLSLIANGFDNFTHGLAIGASFLVGTKVGLLTTFVIFIHEIPHEICDYAILVNSGFSRWDAVKAQSSVSLFGILGTITALYVKSVQALTAKTVWILPFSAGGFLYIALVNLLPEILDHETDAKNSFGQIVCVILGIAFMGLVAIF